MQWLIRGGRRNSSNTILHKLFPGGLINIFGGNAPGEMRRAKGNLLFADEVDALQEQTGDEGDQLEIFWMRGSEYSDAIKIAASYPSITGQSRIAKLLDASDCRKWFTPCPKCGEKVLMLREHIRWPEGKPELAGVEMPCCGAMVSDAERRRIVGLGEWVPTKDFNGIRGYWGNGMMSPHPKQKGFKSHLHWVAQKTIDAEVADNPDRAQKVLVNTFDALPYTPAQIDAPEVSILMARREDYQPRISLPDGVLMITAGVDIQKEWIECSLWGWGDNKESWHLEHSKLAGNVDDPATWAKLDKYLANCNFPHPLGIDIGLRAAMIDAGKWPDIVCEWTRLRASRKIFASQGSPTINAPLVKAARHEFIKGTRSKVKVYPLGVNAAKDLIYSRLTLSPAEPGEEQPSGYVHFPMSSAQPYFEGLTCEYGKEEKYRGDVFTRYVNPPGKRNEPLDCYVYALAAASLGNVPMPRLRASLVERAKQEAGDGKPQPPKQSNYLGVNPSSWL